MGEKKQQERKLFANVYELRKLAGSISDSYHERVRVEIERLYGELRHDYCQETEMQPLCSLLSDKYLRGGKQVRPLLLVAAFSGSGGQLTPAVITIAASLELLHNFTLIHDDICDGSGMRRNRPAFHISLEKGYAAAVPAAGGASLAMIAGDALFAFAMRKFIEAGRDFKQGEKAVDILTETAVCTALGEFREMVLTRTHPEELSEEGVIRLYDQKTGKYSFQAPLITGALLADAPETAVDELAAGGRDLGRAYQMLDDISDLYSVEGDDRPCFEDIGNGMVTLPLLRLYNICDDTYVKSYIRRCQCEYSAEDVDKYLPLSEWLDEYGVTRWAGQYVLRHCASASDRLMKHLRNNEGRELLSEIITGISKTGKMLVEQDIFRPVSCS